MPGVCWPSVRVACVVTLLAGTSASGQQVPVATSQTTSPPVFRANTELVQTNIVVFDERGRIVQGLSRDQFELRVDAVVQPVSFFEQVHSGSLTEEAQRLAAGASAASPDQRLPAGARTVLFFVDDLHLGFAGQTRTRQILNQYIDKMMGPHDQVAIVTSSGQLGFLQQLTSSRKMLRTATARLGNRTRAIIDLDRPVMTIHQARLIDRSADRDLFEVFVKETLRLYPFMRREAAENLVTGRARQMVAQATQLAQSTLATLDAVVRSNGELPGRKLLIFLSDGFETDASWADVATLHQSIASAASRYSFVIYTVDTRGLATQPSYEAGREAILDDTRAVDRSNADELLTSQDTLFRLANDTGGRPFLNSNAFDSFVPRALEETGTYYILAWTPPSPTASRNTRTHRIDVRVKGRPDLTVRFPRSYYEVPSPPARNRRPPSAERSQPPLTEEKTSEEALLAALRSIPPVTTLPVSVALGFVDVPNSGAIVASTTEIDTTRLDFDAQREARVDIAGAVFDDDGKGILSFKDQIAVPRTERRPFSYRRKFQLKPGLYQMRVAARDQHSGLLGSASEWIDIPKLQGGSFSMSSLILERIEGQTSIELNRTNAEAQLEVGSNYLVRRESRVRVLTYIYNAGHGRRPADISMTIQVMRTSPAGSGAAAAAKPIIATRPSRLKTDGISDLSRLPYFAEVNFEGMPIGAYILQVTATDRTTSATATEQISLEIE